MYCCLLATFNTWSMFKFCLCGNHYKIDALLHYWKKKKKWSLVQERRSFVSIQFAKTTALFCRYSKISLVWPPLIQKFGWFGISTPSLEKWPSLYGREPSLFWSKFTRALLNLDQGLLKTWVTTHRLALAHSFPVAVGRMWVYITASKQPVAVPAD